MNNIRLTWFIFLWMSLVAIHAADQPNIPDFSNYPDRSFKHYLTFHTNAVAGLLKEPTNLLAISSFPRGPRSAVQYLVTTSGAECDFRNVYNWAIQAYRSKQLTETELNRLRSAMGHLPVESKSPPIKRLVIVSFSNGLNWVTYSYDSAALPKALTQIYEILGDRGDRKPE